MFVFQQFDYDVSKSAFTGVYPSFGLLSLLNLQLMFFIYFKKWQAIQIFLQGLKLCVYLHAVYSI